MPDKVLITLWSNERLAGGTTADYVVVLNPPLRNIVGAEWTACSIPGLLLNLEELNWESRTTKGLYYWRFVNDLVNYGSPSGRVENFDTPYNLERLTIHWRNPDGTVPTTLPEHVLELEFWVESGAHTT